MEGSGNKEGSCRVSTFDARLIHFRRSDLRDEVLEGQGRREAESGIFERFSMEKRESALSLVSTRSFHRLTTFSRSIVPARYRTCNDGIVQPLLTSGIPFIFFSSSLLILVRPRSSNRSRKRGGVKRPVSWSWFH